MKLTIEIAYNCCVKNPDGIEKVYEVMEGYRSMLRTDGTHVYYGSPNWNPDSNPYSEDFKEDGHWNFNPTRYTDNYRVFAITNFFKAINFETTKELKDKIKLFIKDCETKMDKLEFKHEFIGGYLSEKFKKSADELRFITILDDDYNNDDDNEYINDWSEEDE